MVPGGMPPPGFPVLAPTGGLVIKNTWSPKREQKLRKMYREIVADGRVTPKEVKKVLKKMGYYVDEHQAQQVLFAMDTNRDGRISFDEFYVAMKTFSMNFPKTPKALRKSKKDKKMKKKYY